MFLAGDEFANTQFGNNNPYCQDNIISWLDWNRLEKNRNLFEFFKYLIAFRKQHDPVRKHTPSCSFGFKETSIHDVNPWTDGFREDSHYIGVMFAGRTEQMDDCVYIAVNTYWEELELSLPALPVEQCWQQVIDTFNEDSIMNPPVNIYGNVKIRERSVMVFQTSGRGEM